MYWLIILAILILDLVTKYFFTSTVNTGVAFGLFQGYNWIFIIVSIIALIICVFNYKKHKLEFSFLIGGILGNLIDRIFFGFVRDFIDLRIWPVFNIADSFIVIGALLLGYKIFKDK